MKNTMFAVLLVLGACGGGEDEEPLYNITVTCTAECDGQMETRVATECTTKEQAQMDIDEAVDECANTLMGQCAAWNCNCSYPQDPPRCD